MKLHKNPHAIRYEKKLKDDIANHMVDLVVHRLVSDGFLEKDEDDEAEDADEENEVVAKPANRLRNRR